MQNNDYRSEYDCKVIGANLKRFRNEKGLSVKDVADYLRMGSVQAVYRYENGENYPQADTLLALMELYEIGPKDLVNTEILDIPDVQSKSDQLGEIIDAKICIFENKLRRTKALKSYYDFYNQCGNYNAVG